MKKFKQILWIVPLVVMFMMNVGWGQIYLHDFGTTAITTKPYTGAPITFAANLSSSSWTTSAAAFGGLAGNGGGTSQSLSLSNSSGTPTFTLTFNVATGYQVAVTSFDFWRVRSASGAANWSMTINGTSIGSGTIPTSGAMLGQTNVSNTISGLTGTITVVYTMSGASGSGTCRLDDFTLNGSVTATGSLTPPTLTAAVNPTVDSPFDVTFTDNSSWRGAITSITVGGTTLTAGYSVSAGKITFTPSASNPTSLLQTSGTNKSIVVIATGYDNATVSQTISTGSPTSNSTSSIDAALATNTTRTVTCTAKDQYNNLASGYTFKYDATITNSDGTTNESYTIDGTARTSTVTDINLTTLTNSSGVATFTIVVPATVDLNDGISVQVQLSNGTTNIGSAYSFLKTPPQITLTGIDPGSAGFTQGVTNNILYRVKVDVINDNSVLSALSIITSGNYTSSDIQASGIKLWYSTSSTFGSGTTIGTLSSSSTGTGEVLSFTGLTQTFSIGTAYLFITADISATATVGHTISGEPTQNSDFTFSNSATFSGSSFASAALHSIIPPPALTEVIFPQYAINGTTTASRLQYVCRLTLTNLTPNATYRYYTYASGAGNMFAINNTSSSAGYIVGYSSNKTLGGTLFSGNEFSSSGRYAELTTDGSGSYSGWFSMVPTGNAVFDAGSTVNFSVILNDGAGGTAIVTTLTSASTITMINPASGANGGQAILGTSFAGDEKMVFLYDNTSGTGRPIYGTWTENTGITTTFTTWYETLPGRTTGGWGAYIPVALSNGIRRIEFKNTSDNSLIYAQTDNDGNWGGTVNTVNPSGGTTPLVVPNIFDDLNVSSSVSLNSSVTVNGTLTLTSGNLATGANTLYFGTSAINPVEAVGKTIIGTAVMNSRNVGTGAINFLSVSIAAGGDNLGNVVITRKTGTAGIITVGSNTSIACNWIITVDNQPTMYGRNVIYSWWSDFDNGKVFTSGNKGQVWVSTDGTHWVTSGFPIDVSTSDPRSILNNSVTQFSYWVVSSQDAPMPVELSSFTSNIFTRDVKLNWVTASENNNAGFEILRSAQNDNGSWTKVGYVTGNGTKTTPTNYSFEDKNLNTGKYNYRLKQIDYNGNFEYFNLAGEVEIGVPKKFDISQNYPNPFNPTAKIDFDLPYDSKVSMKLYDISGREVMTLVNEQKSAGYYTVQMNGNNLSSGMYFYRIIAEGNGQKYVMTKKAVLIK